MMMGGRAASRPGNPRTLAELSSYGRLSRNGGPAPIRQSARAGNGSTAGRFGGGGGLDPRSLHGRAGGGRVPDREQLLAQHPELVAQLEACLAGIDFVHRATGPTAEEPAVLGEFRIIREIGRGGMGVVYEAEQTSLRRRVALKVLRFGVVADLEAMKRFQREAETIASLHHTNIVPIFAVGCERGVHYYAMQFIDGRSLAEVLAESETARESGCRPNSSPAGACRRPRLCARTRARRDPSRHQAFQPAGRFEMLWCGSPTSAWPSVPTRPRARRAAHLWAHRGT